MLYFAVQFGEKRVFREVAVKELVRGQRMKLKDLTESAVVRARMEVGGPSKSEMEVGCLGLDGSGSLSDDRYFIMGDRKRSPEGALEATGSDSQGMEGFRLDLALLPSGIQRLLFIVALEGAMDFSRVSRGRWIIGDEANLLAEFSFADGNLGREKAAIIGEIYRKDDVWRLAAAGQGFEGGLEALLSRFGGERIGARSPLSGSSAAKRPEERERSSSSGASGTGAAVRLSKVSLKKGEWAPLSLEKGGAGIRRINVKLSWTQAVDLDLHAFYKTKNGRFGHVYFASKGSLNKPPYIRLDEDMGVGNTAGDNEENIAIATLEAVDCVLVATNIFRFFGFLSRGDHFAKYDGRVVVKTDRGDEIEVPLTSKEKGRWCIIAKIDNTDSSHPRVVNINEVRQEEPAIKDY